LYSSGYPSILHYEIPVEQFGYWQLFTISSVKEQPDNKLKDKLYEWDQLPVVDEMSP
jgi:hypothetical protein